MNERGPPHQACLHLPISQMSEGEQPDVWLCLTGVRCPARKEGTICLPRPTDTSVLISSELDKLGAMPVLWGASLRAGASGCEVYAEPSTMYEAKANSQGGHLAYVGV